MVLFVVLGLLRLVAVELHNRHGETIAKNE